MAASCARARRAISGRDTNGPRRGSALKHRFSAIDRLSQNASSWWTMPIPARRASRGLSNRTAWPCTWISPASGRSMPASSLLSVLLPAPFSPHSAWHEPARDREADVLQRAHAGEALADPAQLDGRHGRAAYFSFRYSSGTSGNPHCRSWRDQAPSVSIVTRTGSIETIAGTSCL